MVDPPATPHRGRWLHVVRDGEPRPDPGPALPQHPAEPAGLSRPAAYRRAEYRPGADRPGADRPGADRPGADRPGADRPGADRPGADRVERETAGRGLAEAGSVPAPAAPRGVGAGWPEAVEGAGRRWVIVRATAPVPWGRRVARVWAGVTVGTAVAGILDRLVGGLDGRPALFLLVVLALPLWDGLPARVTMRLAELAVVVAAVAAAWLAVAAIRPEGWWRAEIAYGLACGIAGTAHALLSRRRTVER